MYKRSGKQSLNSVIPLAPVMNGRHCRRRLPHFLVQRQFHGLINSFTKWPKTSSKHGLKMNLDKTEVTWVGKQREELNIRLEGKYIKQVKNVEYLGGNISENGRVEVDVRCRIQAGANAWRNVEGLMVDRKISRKLK